MATDLRRRTMVGEAVQVADVGRFRFLVDTALTRAGQIICGWRGHSSVLQFDRSRVFLQCMSCGHQSPGWQIERASPLVQVVPVRRVSGEMTVARKVA